MSPLPVPLLDPDPAAPFPDPCRALREPDGLLAVGGDLSPVRLLNAYRRGIFPWFGADQPILWWSPDPRMVVRPAALHLSRRFRRQQRDCRWTVRADSAFEAVIKHCARLPRRGQSGTWITVAMQRAYCALHRLGHAHSVEIHDGESLVGGIYGIAIGRMFFGESMFSLRPGGSKIAIAALARQLARWDFELLDGQVESAHLATLGFSTIPRSRFIELCDSACVNDAAVDWRAAFDGVTAADVVA